MFETLGKHKKALVFGAGGGNDIVSAVLIAMYLQRKGIKTDVGGMLSPAAIHHFQGNIEDVVNENKGDATREIPAKKPVRITFIDGFVPKMVADAGVKIERFYGFSTRFGTTALEYGIKELVEKNKYDLVVAVDVGGDILARSEEDPTLLSPMMDFTSLYILSTLYTDCLLVEFGLGTDGELRPLGMRDVLDELRDKKLLLGEEKIHKDDPELEKFRAIYEKVRKIRLGNTARMTLQTLDTPTPDQDIVSEYRFRSRIGRKKWYTPYTVVLPSEYFGKVFAIDGRKLAKLRPSTAVPYRNALEQYVKVKRVHTWKTELDLGYLWSGDKWTSTKRTGHCLQLLMPSTMIPEKTRKEIIRAGIADLKNGKTDFALMLGDDLEYVPGSFLKKETGRFYLVTQEESRFLEQARAAIEVYQIT